MWRGVGVLQMALEEASAYYKYSERESVHHSAVFNSLLLHGLLCLARILKWIAVPFSRGSS